MPPTGKATPLKVPTTTNGLSYPPTPLTPRTPAPNIPKPTSEVAGTDESGDATLGMSSPLELTAFVDSVLKQLESKFTSMSQEVLGKMDEMSSRIDALEMSLQDLLSSDLTTLESPGPLSTTTYSSR